MVLIVGVIASTIGRMTSAHTDPSKIAAGLVDLLDLRESAPFRRVLDDGYRRRISG